MSGAAGHLSVQQLEALHGVARAPESHGCGRRHEADGEFVAGDGAKVSWQQRPTTVDIPAQLTSLPARVVVWYEEPGDGGGAGRGPGGAVGLE